MIVVGLMSGTSMDGVSAALVEINSNGVNLEVELIKYETIPYPRELKARLLRLASSGDVKELCRLNFAVGEVFANAALRISDGEPEIDLIGSHGQTICHLPALNNNNFIYTLQIGEPDIIAERTGVTTVADFRPRDIAAGGQGAPLIPFVDYKLFRSEERSRVLLNIGGIANLTYLPAGAGIDQVIAFDTGPGNMIIDQLIRIITNREKEYDKNGELAAQGKVNPKLLGQLMDHPFIKRHPPKSTGRKDFGIKFAEDLYHKAGELNLAEKDLVATTTAFTAQSVFRNSQNYIGPIDELIVSGGGTHNRTLMGMLEERFECRIVTTDSYGIPVQAKEAVGFALLAYQTYRRRVNNVPSATGADHPTILGKISWGKKGA